MKVNLIGGDFSHTTGGHTGKSSTHGKIAKHVQWVKPFQSDISIYVDNGLSNAAYDTFSTRKFGWLMESKYITPDLVEHVYQNYQDYVQHFECIFTHNKNLLSLDNCFRFAPAYGFYIQKPKIYQKSKLISMVSSNKTDCEGHRYRLQWVKKLRNSLDLYGRGFNPIEHKEEGLCDYMFSVAIENGNYESYFTEKILDCFVTGTIPIYRGSPDIANYFNPDGIIFLNEDFQIENLNPDMYYSKMDAIKDNFERALKIEIIEDWIYEEYLK